MKSYLPVVIILLLLGLGAILIIANNNQSATNNKAAAISVTPTEVVAKVSPTEEVTPTVAEEELEETVATKEASPSAKSKTSAANTIVITDASTMTPGLTVAEGTKVTWTNNSSKPIQIASDPHPQHTDYPKLNTVGTIAPKASKSFTFTEAGEYVWHNHLKPSVKGVVTVE